MGHFYLVNEIGLLKKNLVQKTGRNVQVQISIMSWDGKLGAPLFPAQRHPSGHWNGWLCFSWGKEQQFCSNSNSKFQSCPEPCKPVQAITFVCRETSQHTNCLCFAQYKPYGNSQPKRTEFSICRFKENLS